MKHKVVTLCGHTTFKDEFEKVNRELTLRGYVVLSCGVFRTDVSNVDEHRDLLQSIHKQKIDMSDEIFVINKGGFISENVQEEIDYAKKKGKIIAYLLRT